MKKKFVWGIHAEIFAAAISFRRPVLVAVPKTDQQYYWAKYDGKPNNNFIFPTTVPELLHDSLTHFEICLENSDYDVVLTSDGSTSCTPPFTGESSSSHLVTFKLLIFFTVQFINHNLSLFVLCTILFILSYLCLYFVQSFNLFIKLIQSLLLNFVQSCSLLIFVQSF